jgi:hypothetical protein
MGSRDVDDVEATGSEHLFAGVEDLDGFPIGYFLLLKPFYCALIEASYRKGDDFVLGWVVGVPWENDIGGEDTGDVRQTEECPAGEMVVCCLSL